MTTAIDPLDSDRLQSAGLVARVEYHATIGSTQDRAHELARSTPETPLPCLIVAEQQTAGRGRGANRWWTGPGSLAFSLLFDPRDWALSRHPVPERSLAVGVAIVDAVQPLVVGARVGLHWPNDVFVAGKKLAGVLIDVLPDGRHVVGIGINVNNSLDAAPADVRARATSLCELAGIRLDRTSLLLNLLSNLELALRGAAAAPRQFGARYQKLCLQVGTELTIEVGTQRTTARSAGIAPDGALLLETSAGGQKFYSGVVR